MFASCSDDSINDSDFLAGETFTDSNVRVLLLDSLTVKLSTMKFDSIVTSDGSRMLVGEYTDPVFGTVKSSSFIEMVPSSYDIDEDAYYDSIVFILRYDNYYYNDTIAENTYHIKELSEALSPDSEDDYFYNTSSVDYYEDDLGSITVAPRPIGRDSIYIKLDDTFGLDLFQKLQDEDLTDYDEFVDYFKGFVIQPDDTANGTVLGFSLSSDMRLYYSIAGETDTEDYYTSFTINTTSSPVPFFNQISAADPISYLSGLTDNEVNLYSEDAQDQSFVQSGIGITTRIEIPYLKSLGDIQGQGTLLSATLRIKPQANSYNDYLMLQDTLGVYVVDQNNDLSYQTSMEAILNTDNEEFDDIYYEVSLSSYLEDILETDLDNTDALILLPSDYTSKVDRVILDANLDSESPQLEIIYAIYDEDE